MPIQKQLISIPLGSQAMNTDVDPKLNPGVVRSMDTMYNREGAMSKRYGSEKVISDETFTDTHVAPYQGNPIVVGDSIATTPTDASGAFYSRTYNNSAKFLDIDAYGVGHSRKDLWYYCDQAESVNVISVSYTTYDVDNDSYGIYVETFDKVTGIRLDSVECETGLSHIAFCKIVQIGDIRISFYYGKSNGWFYGGAIHPETGAIEGPGPIYDAHLTHQDRGPQFDVTVAWKNEWNPYTILAYPRNDGYGIVLLDLAGGSTTYDNMATVWMTASGTSLRSISLFPQKNYDLDGYFGILAEYEEGGTTNVYCGHYDYNLTQKGSPIAVDTNDSADGYVLTMGGVAKTDYKSDLYICWNDNSTNIPYINKSTYTNTLGTGSKVGPNKILERAKLATEIAREGLTTHHYYGVFTKSWGYSYGTQDELLWMDKDQNVVGKSFVGTARVDSTPDAYNILPQLQLVDDINDGYEFTTGMNNLIYDDNSLDNKDLYQIRRLRIKSNLTGFPNVVELPDGLFIANACPYELDDSRVHEAGFLQYPEPFSLTASSGSGLEEGIYHYLLVYEWTDSRGVRHRSYPSPEIGEVTTASPNQQVTIVCPTLTFTRKENVQIAVYRTKVGPTTRFYRIGTVDNDTTASTVTYTDSIGDDEISYNEAIYTTGNVLPNAQPYNCEIATVFQNRLFYVDREHSKTRVYYTKEFSSVSGPGYSDSLLITCDSAGGKIIALAALLDKLIIFKNDRIYATEGQGLDSTGRGNNFTSPYLVSPNIGCANKHSIVQVPNGIMFQAADAIWLLDNSLQLTSVGDPVVHYTDSLTVKGTGKDNPNNLVKFYTDGYGLVYNWDKNKWSLWTNRECVSAAYIKDNTYWLDSSGYLWKEDTDSYTDDSTNVYSRIDSGWFSFSNIGGYQRVYRIFLIGQKVSAHKLRVRIGYDYDGYYSDVQTFDSDAITAFDHTQYFTNGSSSFDGEHYVLQIFPRYPRCSSIRISVEEYGIDGTADAGWDLNSIAFLVGVENESVRVKNGKTINGA